MFLLCPVALHSVSAAENPQSRLCAKRPEDPAEGDIDLCIIFILCFSSLHTGWNVFRGLVCSVQCSYQPRYKRIIYKRWRFYIRIQFRHFHLRLYANALYLYKLAIGHHLCQCFPNSPAHNIF